jgi:hypothetical protein
MAQGCEDCREILDLDVTLQDHQILVPHPLSVPSFLKGLHAHAAISAFAHRTNRTREGLCQSNISLRHLHLMLASKRLKDKIQEVWGTTQELQTHSRLTTGRTIISGR